MDRGDQPQQKNVYKTITEGVIVDAGKSCLRHASVWSFVYILGYYNVGLFWILAPLFISAVFEDDILEWLKSGKKEKEDKVETKILARVNDVPTWVFFPDFERAEWINKILQNVWPNVEEYVINTVINQVDPVLENSENPFISQLEVSRVSFGDIPPRIGGVKVYPRKRIVSIDEIVMEVDLDWASNCDFEVSMKHSQQFIAANLRNVLFQGTLRITMTPLLNEAPLVGGLKLSFLNEPKINFDLDGIAKLLDLPGVSNIIRKIIANQVSQVCVLPNSLFVPLVDPMPEEVSKCPLPAGVLRVQIIQALELMAKDSSVIGGKSSDPYVAFSLNEQCPIVKVNLVTASLDYND